MQRDPLICTCEDGWIGAHRGVRTQGRVEAVPASRQPGLKCSEVTADPSFPPGFSPQGCARDPTWSIGAAHPSDLRGNDHDCSNSDSSKTSTDLWDTDNNEGTPLGWQPWHWHLSVENTGSQI